MKRIGKIVDVDLDHQDRVVKALVARVDGKEQNRAGRAGPFPFRFDADSLLDPASSHQDECCVVGCCKMPYSDFFHPVMASITLSLISIGDSGR